MLGWKFVFKIRVRIRCLGCAKEWRMNESQCMIERQTSRCSKFPSGSKVRVNVCVCRHASCFGVYAAHDMKCLN